MINKERLADVFTMLVEIDSISREEEGMFKKTGDIFESLGAEVFCDNAHVTIGGNTGNLVAKFSGTAAVEPMLLNAHLDTVEPGRGIRVKFENGVFTSSGDTILGADDKSAIAILIEVMHVLKENKLDHGPIELVFTVCEEIGLEGAKNLDYDLITATFGYALDASDTEGIVTRAPAANRLTYTIYGKDAHAGAAPEKGINAIVLASRAIAPLNIGRIDHETTCNIGVIQGGTATNIVPSAVTVQGEVRSHHNDRLDTVTEEITRSFERVVNDYIAADSGDIPRLEVVVEPEFPGTHIPENHRVVELARKAAENLGRRMKTKTTGGGADANIFFEKGIYVGVLGTGMQDMHTVRESVRLEDLVKSAELVLEIIRLHATR
ncbi:MAG: M20/M25/M40 family metallo-hydrolase [Desulfobacterales bacterium]